MVEVDCLWCMVCGALPVGRDGGGGDAAAVASPATSEACPGGPMARPRHPPPPTALPIHPESQ